jgi:hypothetical protein
MLKRAYLQGADIEGAKNFKPWITDSLRMLLDQPGAIRAYKLVTSAGIGPFYGGITYAVGEHYEVKDANTAETKECGSGINLADLPWCCRNWKSGYRILVAEFTAKDIAAIPLGTDGKFRVHRCTIVGEKDLKEIGLGEPEANDERRKL